MRQITHLQDGWLFAKLPEESIDSLPFSLDSWTVPDGISWENVSVPHTWYQYENYYQGLAVYQNTIFPDSKPNFKKLHDQYQNTFLEFEGVDRWCKVYINGIYAGEHQGGYSRFYIPVKPEFKKKGKGFRITVFVDNRDFGVISPLFGDFTVYGGIYRPVHLITVSENHFDMMYYGTSGLLVRTAVEESGDGLVTLEPHVKLKNNGYIRYQLWSPQGILIAECLGDIQKNTCIKITQPLLWNGISQASLYRLRATLICGEKYEDQVETVIGFRTVSINSQKGFFLNGNPFRIKGVAKHQDMDEVFHATARKQQQLDMDILRELGANAVRLSHYQHPQHFYDLCDQEGLVVWAEIPMLKMTENPRLLENACLQLTELILQNLHHPSICFWGIQNEIAMFRDTPYMHASCKRLYELAISLDKSRLITAANLNGVSFNSPLNQITDMIGYNLYFGWYYGTPEDYGPFLDSFHQAMPQIPLGISEYGVDCCLRFHSKEPKVKDYSEEYQALFHETVYPIFESRPYLWGSFVWNLFDFGSGIRDEGGEKYKNCKGLVTFDRKTKKDAFYYYKARWSEEPFVCITEKRFQKRDSENLDVKIYSNCGSVDLYLNHVYLKTQHPEKEGVFIFKNIPLSMGENHLAAVSGICRDETVFIRTEMPEPSYVFHNDLAGETVRNWFLNQNDNGPDLDFYSFQDTADTLSENPEAMAVIRCFMPDSAERIENEGGGLTLARIIGYEAKKYKDLDMETFSRRLNQVKKLKKSFQV